MRHLAGVAIMIGAVVQAAPATAQQPRALDLPAGTVGSQVLALGARTGVNVGVGDPLLWSRRVPALRGRMTAAQAIRRIAAAGGAEVVVLGTNAYRLVPRRQRTTAPARPRPAPRRAAPVPTPPAEDDHAEIVVTASKRDLSFRDFAGQVSVVPGSDLDLGGAGGTGRVVDRLTGVASTYLGAGRNKLFVRGIADSSFAGPTQPTAAQYFGDLRLNYTGPDPDLRLIDMARVEVLGGPQGTLYGAGSLGGLIRLVPNAPDATRTQGMVGVGGSLTTHGAPGYDAQAVLNLPLAPDRSAIRIAGFTAEDGGYIDKPSLGRRDVNRTRIAGGRASVRFDLSDDWTIDIIGMGQRIRAADSQYAEREGPRLSRASPVVEGSSARFAQVQAGISGRWGDVKLRSTVGATAQDLTERYDATVADEPVRLFVLANRTRMIANETRAWRTGRDGAGWIVGASVVRNDTWTDRRIGAPDALRFTIGVTNRTTEATLYGEASIRLFPNLLATGGLRASSLTVEGRAEGAREPGPPDPPAELAGTDRLHSTRGVILPSASLLVDLSPLAQAFVRYQRGFRPAGFAVADDRLRRFRDDSVDTAELGARVGAARGTEFALTLAYTDWRDIQADFLDGAGMPSTANIGDGRILTVEASGRLRIAPGLHLAAAASYNESSVALSRRIGAPEPPTTPDDPTSSEGLTARLDRIPNVAPLTARFGATFEREIARDTALTVDGWLRYVGPSTLGIGMVLGQSQGDYVDSALTARVRRGAYALALSVTNLADARGNRFALGTPVTTGREQVTPLRPRTLRVGIDASF